MPEVKAAAWEVPLPRNRRGAGRRSVTTAVGFSSSISEPGARRLTRERPGAMRSGLRVALPRLEKVATVSSLRSSVPWWSAAPTAIDVGVDGRVGECLGAGCRRCRRRRPRRCRSPGVLDGVGEGVDEVGLGAVGAVGEVEDPDVEAGVVAVGDDPVDGRDDLGDIDGAVAVGDLDAEQVGVGGDADELLLSCRGRCPSPRGRVRR